MDAISVSNPLAGTGSSLFSRSFSKFASSDFPFLLTFFHSSVSITNLGRSHLEYSVLEFIIPPPLRSIITDSLIWQVRASLKLATTFSSNFGGAGMSLCDITHTYFLHQPYVLRPIYKAATTFPNIHSFTIWKFSILLCLAFYFRIANLAAALMKEVSLFSVCQFLISLQAGVAVILHAVHTFPGLCIRQKST